MATIKSFEELEVWKEAISFCKEVYIMTSKTEFEKDWAIRDQIRRATVSISNNIAEGFEYNNNNYFLKHLRIAKGSCGEVRNLIIILLEIKYINENQKLELYNKAIIISKKISGLIKYIQEYKNNQELDNKQKIK
jgi:four helix bundle protein